MCNIIIIGGMAAGCKAAARLRRLSKDYKIVIVERKNFISFGNCGLPLYASGDIDDLLDLERTSYGVVRDRDYFHEIKDIEVLLNTEVQEINNTKNEVICFSLDREETFSLKYDELIIATGTEPKKPVFPCASSPAISFFHSPADSQHFRHAVQQGKVDSAAIIGGGFIGCEMLEALTSLWGIKTILIEKEKSLLPGCLDPEISFYLESCINSDKIKFMLSTSVNRIETGDNGLPVIYPDESEKINADYVFNCLGVTPNSLLAQKANIKTGKFGGILVDEQMKTNLPNIRAAGDCVEIKNIVTGDTDYFSFGSLANRMGRVAADSIAGKNTSFKGASGTFSLKLFNNIVCATGLTEEKAHSCGLNTESVLGSWSDRPDYYPEVKNLLGKLVYEKYSLRLLGLQLIGEGEVTRYLDVFSQLLNQKGTIKDLLNLEHGYTPAHSSPISPLNNMGYMAINQEIDGIKNFNPLLISDYEGIFIDVREQNEIESYPFLEKCTPVPLSELRLRLNEWNHDQPIMFVCEKGPRSYEAARMFVNKGFKSICYLGGGNILYNKIKKKNRTETYNSNLTFDLS